MELEAIESTMGGKELHLLLCTFHNNATMQGSIILESRIKFNWWKDKDSHFVEIKEYET